jgi:hypothetical protein
MASPSVKGLEEISFNRFAVRVTGSTRWVDSHYLGSEWEPCLKTAKIPIPCGGFFLGILRACVQPFKTF